MPTSQLIFLLIAMLLVSILVEPLARKIRLPFSAALVLVGFIGSEILVAGGIDTGIRWDSFQDLIFYVLIPVLVFESAFNMSFRNLLRDLVLILGLAIPAMLLATVITAFIVFSGIAHPQGFPWIAALLTGALVSATDPVSVLALLKQNQAPERISTILEGESLFNDATAIVLFSILITMATSSGIEYGWTTAVTQFLLTFFGGAAAGIVVGGLAAVLVRLLDHPVYHGIITIVGAYTCFLLAEDMFHFSGVMAVLANGLVVGEVLRRKNEEELRLVKYLWALIGYVSTAAIFLLAGATVTLHMFNEQWLAMMIGIAAVIVARVITVFGFANFLGWLPGVEPLPQRQQLVIAWGGIRGAVTVALALSLPLELDYWFTIQSIAYGVVLFTLFVQAPAMASVVRKFAN